MYLDIIIVDSLDLDGKVTSTYLFPQNSNFAIIGEDLNEKGRLESELKGIGLKVLNPDKLSTDSRKYDVEFTKDNPDPTYRFKLTHDHVPGSYGLYYLIMPKDLRFVSLKISKDEHGNNGRTIKKEVDHTIGKDIQSNRVIGFLKFKEPNGERPSFNVKGIISKLDSVSKGGKFTRVSDDFDKGFIILPENLPKKTTILEKFIRAIELKPGIFGVNFDLKKLLELD